MKHHTNGFIICMLLVVAVVLTGAETSWANVAANAQIINQATLNYDDGTGTKTATAAVTVTVALVAASPTVTLGPDQSGSYSVGATLTDTLIVTAASNGPDTYTVTASVTSETNTSGATAAPTSATVTLGATVTADGSDQTNIIVPADGTADAPGEVNGIKAGDTVVIDGESRTVDSVVDNASSTSTIVLSSPLTNAAPTAGVLVAEQQTIQVTVGAGTIGTPGTDVVINANLTVTSNSSGAASTTSGSVANTFASGVASLAKYVRNLRSPEVVGTTLFTYSGNNYYQADVTAAPGDTLEYLLVATNSGSGAVAAAIITDILPTDFVTLEDGAYDSGSKEVTYVDDTGSTSFLTKALDNDTGKYDAGSAMLTVYVGTGATSAVGGSIPGGNKSVMVLYQVTVKP